MEISEGGRKSPKRLLIDIDEDIHKKIRWICDMRNITMRRFIMRAIIKAIAEEEKYSQRD